MRRLWAVGAGGGTGLLALPALIAGELPTTAAAQRASKLLKLAVVRDKRE